MIKRKLNKNNSGFTILELMIALSVLSLLLTICTVVLLNLGRMYVKGNNKVNVQNTARNIIKDISDELQLSGAQSNFKQADSSHADFGDFCVGTTRYSYVVGLQVDSSPSSSDHDQTKHGLWRDTLASDTNCPTVPESNMLTKDNPTDYHGSGTKRDSGSNKPISGQELIPENMRMTEFSVESSPSVSGMYDVKVGIAYGDTDLLCVRGASLAGGTDCDTSLINDNPHEHLNNLENPHGHTIGCVSSAGNQFCSVSNLSQIVVRRLPGE